VDLRPLTDKGPFLKNNSPIDIKDTSVPVDENTVLVDLNGLLNSIPKNALATTVDELGKAFDGAGPSLQQLIDKGNEVVKAFQGNLSQTISLIEDAKSVLKTQIDVSGAFHSFAHDIADVAGTLRSSDADFRRLIDNGTLSANELNGLLKDNRGNLGPLLANLVTLGQIQVARLPGLDELLTLYPRVLSAGERVVQDPSKGARFGLDLDQFPVCTNGYAPTSAQKLPDGSAAQNNAAFPLGYTCKEPTSSPIDVKGSRNAPRPAGDTTDPALGGYSYGNASYEGSANGKVVDGAAYDPSSGLVTGPNGVQYLMGADGGQAEVLGADSWKYLLLAPLTS
jgi:phospholipid/cholesterol/gamma-HCH transport system substrate-binding protein